MPDLFQGQPFPPAKDGDKETLGKFFAGIAKLDDRLPELLAFAETLSKQFKTVSLLGYCWGILFKLYNLTPGGKITIQALSKPSHLRCGAIVHPAMLTPEDGDNLVKPLGFYPSKDEPEAPVMHIKKVLEEKPFAKDCDYHLYESV